MSGIAEADLFERNGAEYYPHYQILFVSFSAMEESRYKRCEEELGREATSIGRYHSEARAAETYWQHQRQHRGAWTHGLTIL
jgi:hypothetical protein